MCNFLYVTLEFGSGHENLKPNGSYNKFHINLDKIVLMNHKGEVYYAKLSKDQSQSRGSSIYQGWTNFCTKNKLEDGDNCISELLRNEENNLFQLLPKIKKRK